MSSTIRVSIANVTPDSAALHFQRAGLSGSVAPCVGFGAWGVETGVVATFGDVADVARLRASVCELLAVLGEQAAWWETCPDVQGELLAAAQLQRGVA